MYMNKMICNVSGGDTGLPSLSPFVDIDNVTLGYNRVLEGNTLVRLKLMST